MINLEKTSMGDGNNNPVITALYTKIEETEDAAKLYVEGLYIKPPKIGEKVERKWGYYEILDIGTSIDGLEYQVKRLVFNPGGALSYQKHFKRRERWVLVHGNGMFQTESRTYPYYSAIPATINMNKQVIEEGDVISIEIEQLHKFTGGPYGAIIIETWIGICDENDIERIPE